MLIKRDRWIWGLLPLGIVALYLNFVWSPDDRTLGPSERIFYFHMGAAAAAGLAFTITFVASIGYLVRRGEKWDVWGAASAEIGTVFTAMVLVSGVLWGRAAWGVWWTWDPRLTATLILWVLFAGYLLLREWADSPERQAVYSAVLAIFAYVDVPIDYMTIHWWHSIHPIVITAHGLNMAPRMIVALVVSQFVFLGILIAWMQIRMRLLRAERNIASCKNIIRSQLER